MVDAHLSLFFGCAFFSILMIHAINDISRLCGIQVVAARGGQRPLLCVVNLLSMGVVWSIPVDVTALAVDAEHAVVAVATPHPASRCICHCDVVYVY